ncbi:MAG: GNAT family N-acetyltransferase, partial [Gemmatimonadota bacterium]|nr:GNAT family N-acetyltransferase [Gemmatimonadota bacterium]
GALEPDCFFLDLPSDPGELVRAAPTRGPVVIPSLPTGAEMSRLAIQNGRIRYLVYRFPRYLVRMQESFDDYMSGLSSKTRYAIRKSLRRLEAHAEGDFRMEEYRTPDEVGPFLDAAATVSGLTYQTRLLKAGLTNDAETLARLLGRAEVGEFWSFMLFVGETPISYMLGTTRGRIYRQDHGGYDPTYHNVDPGRALHGLALERLHESGEVDVLDFTPGDGAHKEKLSTEAVECVDLVYFPPTPKAVFLVGTHLMLQGVSRATVRVMDALGIKTRIKQLLRRSGQGETSAVPQ